jgi:hypothetical protein
VRRWWWRGGLRTETSANRLLESERESGYWLSWLSVHAHHYLTAREPFLQLCGGHAGWERTGVNGWKPQRQSRTEVEEGEQVISETHSSKR